MKKHCKVAVSFFRLLNDYTGSSTIVYRPNENNLKLMHAWEKLCEQDLHSNMVKIRKNKMFIELLSCLIPIDGVLGLNELGQVEIGLRFRTK
jgi:hypothetical protein